MGIFKILHLVNCAGLDCQINNKDLEMVSESICNFISSVGFDIDMTKDLDQNNHRRNYIYKKNTSLKKQIIYMDLTQKENRLFYTIFCDYQKRGFYFGHNYNDELISNLANFLQRELFGNITKRY